MSKLTLQELDDQRKHLALIESFRRAIETIRRQRFTIGCQAAIIQMYREQDNLKTVARDTPAPVPC